METNEIPLPPSPTPEPHTELVLNFEAQTYLREAGKWAGFLGIIGFIFCGLILILAFSIGSIMAKVASVSPTPMALGLAGMGGLLTVIYILIDVIYFFFSLYLYQFGSQIKSGLAFTDNYKVTSALGKLKSFFKLWGILTIIALSLYALVFIVAIIAGIGVASMSH